MTIIDTINWVFKAVLGQRQRSLLTTLGIAIGIAAVAMLTSIGEGVRQYMMSSFSQFGTRIIAVSPGKVTTQGMAGMLRTVKPLTVEDAESLRSLPHVESVVSVVSGAGEVEAGDLARDCDILGVSHEAAKAWKFNVAQGRFLPPDDPLSPRAYAVLGYKLKNEIFPNISALGQMIRVGGMRYRVIGVMERKGQFLGFDLDDVVYIPVGRALQMFDREGVMEIDIVFSESTTSKEMSKRISQRLETRHRAEDFTLFTQEDMLASLDSILALLTLAVAALGGISLFVGAVGILTIMTIALRERKPEIGLLCALGCTRQQTLILFLGEAMVLAGSGGLLGIALVIVLVLLLALLAPSLPLALNPFYLLMAWLLSMVIGLIAGITPAWNASRLDPIEALRDE